MKFSIKILSGSLILSALVGIYFLDESLSAKKAHQKEENAVALYFENNECIKFAMQNPNGRFVFERENFQSPWRMTEPKSLMADQDAVNSTLVLLRNISVQRAFTVDKNLENYGLAQPLLHVEITLKNNKTKILSFGKNLNDDTNSAFHFPSAYAQATDRPNILVVDNSSLSAFYEKKYEDFRTKQISYFKSFDVAKIFITQNSFDPLLKAGEDSIKAQNNITLIRKDAGWVATSPQSAPGDDAFILKYIQMFEELTANRVIESKDSDMLKANGVQLGSPAASIVFTDTNEKALQELSIYISKSGIYINMPDGSFAQVELDKWPELVPNFKHFRNRSVLLGSTDCTADLNALKADDIIDNVNENELQKFGLAQPLATLSCAENEESTTSSKAKKNKNNLKILIGNRVPLDERNVYIKRSDSNTVYIVNNESLSRLAQLKPL